MAVNTRIVPFPITNKEFLRAIFGARWGEVLVASFPGDPSPPPDRPNPRMNWGSVAAGGTVDRLSVDCNNYFDPSLPNPGGGRRLVDFEALCAIVIDDYGTKVNEARAGMLLGIEPSYVIETSPGNYQAGWRTNPLTDRAWVLGFLRALYLALGKTGDNLVKPMTLVRLPVGTNGKAALGPNGFRVRLVRWRAHNIIEHLDLPNIEKRIGAVTPIAARTSLNIKMPDPAEAEADPILKVFRMRGMVLDNGREMSFGWGFEVICPWSQDHTDPRNAAAYIPVKQTFKCLHGHCEDRNMGDLRGWADLAIREDSGGLECLARQEFEDVDDPGFSRTKTAVGRSQGWQNYWQRGGKKGDGGPLSNLANVMVALRRAPEFEGSFGFNEFTLRQVLHQELPGVVPGTTPGVPREWRDQDTVLLQDWLQDQGLRSVGLRTVDDAVSAVMHEKAYHPVRDWLRGLSWDGIDRLDTWLSRYLGTTGDPYHAHIGRWWLMTMCRRIYEPGCRADYMPVLEGPQGQEKSSFLAALTGPKEWFSDQLPDIRNKDASDHVVGRWLVEIAEMDQHDRAESAAMKAFVSRTTERYRRAYAKRTADEPRQCVFAGTVNHRSYLKDETGNRRYWPIGVGTIDLAGLRLVRDQLFAEAWDRAVRQNEQYWPDPLFEELFIEPEQEGRLEADPWEHLVWDFLRTKTLVLVHEVITACTGGGSLQLSTANRNRVTRIMETLKWKRGKKGPNNERFWYPN